MDTDPLAAHQKRALQLLGLRVFPERSSDEIRSILSGSEMRVAAYDNIDTTTHPRKKREIKKGIVLEMLSQHVWADEIAKKQPLVYIGSGEDVEYVLALGARHITLVDPLFSDETIMHNLERRIQALGARAVSRASDVFTFRFEFKKGVEESVTVACIKKPYDPSSDACYQLPDSVGAVVLYAPSGVPVDEQLIRQHLIEGGVLVSEYDAYRREKDGTYQHFVFGE